VRVSGELSPKQSDTKIENCETVKSALALQANIRQYQGYK